MNQQRSESPLINPSTANLKSARGGLLHRLGQFPFVHRIAADLRIYQLLNWWLSKYPLVRILPNSGMNIQICSIASLVLAEEMFEEGCYASPLKEWSVNTVVDLGCNVGWFPCLLKEVGEVASLEGILVDADPSLASSVGWHLQKNGFSGCSFLHGAVGCPASSKEIIFHINPSNTQSSLNPFDDSHPFPVKGTIREVVVPCLRVSKEWESRFGERIIDVMKVDIEGAEMDFFREEIIFIKEKVKRIIVEWHAWKCSLEEISILLEKNSFLHVQILEKDDLGGVAVFTNKDYF